MNFHFMRMFAQFPLVIIPVLVVTDAFHWNFLVCMCVCVCEGGKTLPAFPASIHISC